MAYPARVVLNRLAQLYPQHANKIHNAQAASYPAEVILRRLIDNGKEEDFSDKSLTEHEKVQRRDKQQKRKAALQALGVLGTAGAIGAGALGYAMRNQSVRPSQISSPSRISPRGGPQQGATINITPRQGNIGGRQPPQIGMSPRGTPPRRPQGPTPNAPSGAGNAIQMPYQGEQAPTSRNPDRNVTVIKNLNEDTRIANILKGTPDIVTATQVLRQVIPRVKLQLLDKLDGGFEQAIQDYAEHLQANPPAIREQFQPRNVDFEQGGQVPQVMGQPEEQIQQEEQQLAQQNQAPIPEMAQSGAIPAQSGAINQEPVNARIAELAPGKAEIRLPNETERRRNFYVPNYKHPGESSQEFAERKILYNLVNKGAKAILEGKSFLDFPATPGVQYSTAADVLRFMGGIPNLYDALLDDTEKEELTAALTDLGTVTQKGMQPIHGEKQNIYGAQLAPNLVWNLLLSIEPKLATMKKPPSMKGLKVSPSGKMGSSEMRRSLTHLVYGVLSGKTVSNELSDKIAKISQAASHIDIIVKAAKDGDRRRMDEEMEKILKDDAYFLDLMNSVAERQLTPEEQEKADLLAKEDTKFAASLKARATREKNKKAKPKNED